MYYTSRRIAKRYGRSACWLHRFLEARGLLIKEAGQWITAGAWRHLPYRHTDLIERGNAYGYGVYRRTRWTEAGASAVEEVLEGEELVRVEGKVVSHER